MSKLLRSLALMTALAAVSAGTVSVAQEKKTPATKVAKKAEGNKAGSIEYYKNDKGKWRYVIKDENDKTVAMPLPQTSYESKEDCLKALEALKKTLNEAKPKEVEKK